MKYIIGALFVVAVVVGQMPDDREVGDCWQEYDGRTVDQVCEEVE